MAIVYFNWLVLWARYSRYTAALAVLELGHDGSFITTKKEELEVGDQGVVEMIYYHIPTDQIFMSERIDAHFYRLMPGVKWDEILILGKL